MRQTDDNLRVRLAFFVLVLTSGGAVSVGADDSGEQRDISVRKYIARAESLIRQEQFKEAAPIVFRARETAGVTRWPEVEGLAAQLALQDGDAKRALKLVAPFTVRRDPYDARHFHPFFAKGCAALALDNPWEAFGLFDWLVKQTAGVEHVLAAEGAARSLVAMNNIPDARKAFDYAAKYATQHLRHGGGDKATGNPTALSVDNSYDWLIDRLTRQSKELAEPKKRLTSESFALFEKAERIRRIDRKCKDALEANQQLLISAPTPPTPRPPNCFPPSAGCSPARPRKRSKSNSWRSSPKTATASTSAKPCSCSGGSPSKNGWTRNWR